MRRILDGHSRISCGPELKFLIDWFGGHSVADPAGYARFVTTARDTAGEDAFDILGGAFLDLHRARAVRAGKPRWADKNPENIIHLDAWTRLLGEDWLLIHVVRNPLDVLASMEEAGFPYSGEDRFRLRLDHYLRYTVEGQRFADAHPKRYLRLDYEDLVTRPVETVTRAMAWIGEGFETGQLELIGGVEGLGDPKAARQRVVGDGSLGRGRLELTSSQVRAVTAAAQEVLGSRS